MPTPLKPLKWYRDLADKKARLEAGVFMVEGDKAIRQVMGLRPDAITEIIAAGEFDPDFLRYPIRQVTPSQFSYFSSARTPQGIAAVVRIPADVYTPALPRDPGSKILLLEDIQDPGNTGTLIRTAAAFGFDGIILTDKCADPFSPKVIQSTAGAVLSLWLRVTGQYLGCADTLQKSGYKIIATDLRGEDSTEVLKQAKFILALGNEAAGLSDELLSLSDYKLRIPMTAEKAESLNVAVAGGILMYLSGREI